MHTILSSLCQRGQLTDLDAYFAAFITQLAGAHTTATEIPALALGAALASHAIGQGDTCVRLHQWAWRAAQSDAMDAVPVPPTAEWLATLRNSRVVGQPGEWQPLILDRRGRLYLQRYWQYEHDVAEDLLQRAKMASETPDSAKFPEGSVDFSYSVAKLSEDLGHLFQKSAHNGPDWQKIAAVVAVLKRVCVISGGPGTGKTSTVLRILALLTGQHHSDHPLRIALAAPTGKAAARLQESVRAAKGQLALSPERLAQIPEEAFTLHRLLGARPGASTFRYHRDHLLPLDVLVIDEMSMVGLALMAKTLAALPKTARLILLGDKDQLASVEAGMVLAEICAGSGRFSPAFREQLMAITGEIVPPSRVVTAPLSDCVVLLKHSYRFGENSGIGALAHAINRGRSTDALTLLENTTHADIAWQVLDDAAALSTQLNQPILAGFADYLEAVRQHADPATLFACFNRFRVLSALHNGPFGVDALNQLCEQVLQRAGLQTGQEWYVGRPILIVRNDNTLRLFNGDVGITLPDPEDASRLKVFFVGTGGAILSVAPARLPQHKTVYAMTVHKSQGSEFDHVLVVLPNVPSRVLSRELLYTALTRAKTRASFYGSTAVLTDAIERRLRRASGLREKLLRDGKPPAVK